MHLFLVSRTASGLLLCAWALGRLPPCDDGVHGLGSCMSQTEREQEMRMKDGSKRNGRIRRGRVGRRKGEGNGPAGLKWAVKNKEAPATRRKHTNGQDQRAQKAHTGHKSPVPKTQKQVVPTWTDTHARRLGLETHLRAVCLV
jgi:hypothetical protein